MNTITHNFHNYWENKLIYISFYSSFIGMIPIKDLLNKIRWSKEENPKDYSIGYWDNIDKKLVFISFNEIKKIEGNFLLLDREEETYIPVHRIKEVKKKDKIVWKR